MRKPKGYWLIEQNFKNELYDTIKKINKFPTQKDLRDINQNKLAIAIERYYGGYLTVKSLYYNI